MKRLTKRYASHIAVVCDNCKEKGSYCDTSVCCDVMLNRLAEYEDTGLTPKEIEDMVSVREITPEAEYAIDKHANNLIQKLEQLIAQTDEKNELQRYKEAEEQGLLVWLPCKPGDTVYWLNYNRSACKTCDLFSSFYGVDCMCDKHYELYPEINSVYDDEHCPKHFIEIVKWKTDLGWIVEHLNDFGKTVFLTSEAAEKALEGMKNEA